MYTTYIFPLPIAPTLLMPLPFSFTFSPDWVPALTSRITFPVRVGISFLHPNVASTIFNGTLKYISSSSLSNIECSLTLNSKYISPLGPPFVPAEPLPDILNWYPVSTPSGIVTSISFLFLTFPLPLHSLHVSS